MSDRISIIVPIYNEEASLPLLVQKIVSVMEGNGLTFEIIAVNDGSTATSTEE